MAIQKKKFATLRSKIAEKKEELVKARVMLNERRLVAMGPVKIAVKQEPESSPTRSDSVSFYGYQPISANSVASDYLEILVRKGTNSDQIKFNGSVFLEHAIRYSGAYARAFSSRRSSLFLHSFFSIVYNCFSMQNAPRVTSSSSWFFSYHYCKSIVSDTVNEN